MDPSIYLLINKIQQPNYKIDYVEIVLLLFGIPFLKYIFDGLQKINIQSKIYSMFLDFNKDKYNYINYIMTETTQYNGVYYILTNEVRSILWNTVHKNLDRNIKINIKYYDGIDYYINDFNNWILIENDIFLKLEQVKYDNEVLKNSSYTFKFLEINIILKYPKNIDIYKWINEFIILSRIF